MSAYATFSPASAADGCDVRVRIAGELHVYASLPASGGAEWQRANRVDAARNEIEGATDDSWSSMRELVVHGEHRYLMTFDLRVTAGTNAQIQRWVNARDFRSIESECVAYNVNVVVLTDNKGGTLTSGAAGEVPYVSPDHESRFESLTNQPYGDVLLLSKRRVHYVAAHEIGHLLGLGEGYAHVTIGEWPAIRTEIRTIPGFEHTPMAMREDAGSQLNTTQRDALFGYALTARDRARSEGVADLQFGPRVRGYRACEHGRTP